METKFTLTFFSCCFFFLLIDLTTADPGRDLCKIVHRTGLKCSKLSSSFFPNDIFMSFNDDMAYFTNEMKYLEITNSNISILQTRSFQRTPHLSHIILSNISLTEIEAGAFEGLRKLKLVDLSYNLFQSLPNDVFKYTKLSRLNLEGNPQLEISVSNPILNAKYLTSLTLKSCKLQSLPEAAFQQTPALMHLDLSQNFLKELPEEIFSSLHHLILVDLSDNRFHTLDIQIFKSIPTFPKFPTAVLLSGNPWVCDCNISKLGEWVTKNAKTGSWSETSEHSRLKNSVECHQPKNLLWNSVEFKKLIDSC